MKPGDDVGNFVFLHRAALVVQGIAVRLHIVKPHLVGAPAPVLVNTSTAVDTPAYGLNTTRGMKITPEAGGSPPTPCGWPYGLGSPEQRPIGDDTGTPSPLLQHVQEEGLEDQLGLYSVDSSLMLSASTVPLKGRRLVRQSVYRSLICFFLAPLS